MKASVVVQLIVIGVLLLGAVPLDIGLLRWFKGGRKTLTPRDRELILFGACTGMLGLWVHALFTDLWFAGAMILSSFVFLFVLKRRRATAQER